MCVRADMCVNRSPELIRMVSEKADVAYLPASERIQQYVYTGDSNGNSYAQGHRSAPDPCHGHHCIILEAVDTQLPYLQPQKSSPRTATAVSCCRP